MKILSSAFVQNGQIPSKYTCDGENISPPLSISNVPLEAVSLVIIMEDPDVPKHLKEDGMWNHWIVFNIPPTTTEVREGENPLGVVGRNTRGDNKYGGPCPPDREHRYFFKFYALDRLLDLDDSSTKFTLIKAMEGHIIEYTELIGRYKRK